MDVTVSRGVAWHRDRLRLLVKDHHGRVNSMLSDYLDGRGADDVRDGEAQLRVARSGQEHVVGDLLAAEVHARQPVVAWAEVLAEQRERVADVHVARRAPAGEHRRSARRRRAVWR